MPNINKVVFGTRTLIDLSTTTLSETSQLANGITAYDRAGNIITGTASGGSGSGGIIYQDLDGYLNLSEEEANVISIVDTLDTAGGTVRTITGAVESGGSDSREDLTTPKDVDFIDFDGRLLYSYTASEFLELTELPPNPSYPGLVAQGWNWTLADAKAYVSEWGALVIGQSYITDDGKTRIYIHVGLEMVSIEAKCYVHLHSIVSGNGTINWGDGATTSITSGVGVKTYSHVYSAVGNYIIEIDIADGQFSLGRHASHANIIDTPISNGVDGRYSSALKKVEIGSGITGFGRQPFHGCMNLESVSIPLSLVGFNDTAASDGSAFESRVMKGVVFPSGFQGKTTRMFEECNSMRYISVPKSTTILSIGTTATRNMDNMRKLTMYSSTDTGASTVRLWYAKHLTHFIMPGVYTTFSSGAIAGSLIKKFTIPSTVTTVQTEVLMYNSFIEELHVLPTTVPTMDNIRALIGINTNCVIYVPYSEDHSILEAYKTATNWSTYASKMQEEPQ